MWNNSSKDSAVGEHPTQEVVPATPSIPPRIRPIIRTTRTDSASLPQDTLVTDSLLVDSLATDSLEAIFPAEKNVLQSAQEVPSGMLGTLPLQLLRQQDGTFFCADCLFFIYRTDTKTWLFLPYQRYNATSVVSQAGGII